MKYPIFNSIINKIESDLTKKVSNIHRFRSWDEEAINATGLEIAIDLSTQSEYIKQVSINLDWDKFREATLANNLSGMEKHPLINEKALIKANISPRIDVEVIWHFNENSILESYPEVKGNQRATLASEWMENMNRSIHTYLPNDNIITRWHVEIEGDLYGKFISDMSLISYQQYSLQEYGSLNEIHEMISRNIQKILIRTNKITRIAERTFPVAA